MRLLLTSAGERVELVEAFQRSLGRDGAVHVAGSDELAPAMRAADVGMVAPPVSTDEYLPAILEHCRLHGITGVLPLIDIDVVAISTLRSQLAGIGVTALVPAPDVAAACLDKAASSRLVTDAGLRSPPTAVGLSEALRFIGADRLGPPLLVKPRFGRASLGMLRCATSELEPAADSVWAAARRLGMEGSGTGVEDGIIIQQEIAGTEFGMDIVSDLEGTYRATLSRQKLRMRHGETSTAITVDDRSLVALGRSLADVLRSPGLVDVDIIRDRRGADHVIDVNPRFGGGYAFSHAAGADVPSAIVAWLSGEGFQESFLRQRAGVVAEKHLRVRRVE